MIKRIVPKDIAVKENFQIWNAFIDLLAMEKEEDLTIIQKNAQRAFWYDSEIQNGGHLQYFQNTDLNDFSHVISSIEFIGAIKHAEILKKAVEKYHKQKRNKIDDVDQLVSEYQEEEFSNLDFEYGSIEPDMNYYLGKYLAKYQYEFIEIE